ncbi:ATP-dependent DNA helicase RecQ [Pustulibacterium marinum]|uniref:DNA helicase RecQ n=1 Tax=Pustulibacterium marinum TaxID=1224947 RepID=A0A1I7FRM1_9FLAO|nr:DNA helicase RecQ [Pustulibacterium marinum]SFU38830.1 ATP-dependent DNA helicase RecQ [Pustulibacterium marinum]
MTNPQVLYDTLKTYFGYDAFRPLQEDIISTVLNGNDALVIMPTGGGKSICYQLPAMVMKGVSIVISPLIALMKDQVDGLNSNGIAAAFINSSQTEAELHDIYDHVKEGNIKLLYVAPESLTYLEPIFNTTEIGLFAVDEAHCISSWGHDFRPAYQQLGFLKNRFPKIPVIALTATADKATREDIASQLNISNAKQFISSFDRSNLSLTVKPGVDRLKQIISFLNERPFESGIVYCTSRKATETVASKLTAADFNAVAYHAGLGHEERSKIQDDFINDNTQIICATIAFGMGIDKSNIRWVIHYNLPKNIEGYYQEIGRAGRDGLPSDTVLFHSYADVVQLRQFATNASNSEVQLAKLDRMKQYADALTCRRRILLSYFGEYLEEDCGNCDVCKNPPQFFDGTIIAQKALSCIARLKEQEPIGTVIDVLRGSQNAAILDNGYQHIKTYGIAAEIAWLDWQQYIIQLINSGYVEIAFHEKNHLKLTSLAKEVLFNKQQVALTKPVYEKELGKPAKKQRVAPAKASTDNNLFERLRQLRLQIAKDEDIPAYHIFSDATLKEMEAERPMSDEALMEISGVGRRKLETYGYQFIKEIIAFSKEKQTKKKKKKSTFQETFEWYEKGLSPEEIAEERNLSLTTIYSHIAKLYEDGKPIDLYKFVDQKEVEMVKLAQKELDNPTQLKVYYEHFQEALDYWTIRLALTILSKEGAAS